MLRLIPAIAIGLFAAPTMAQVSAPVPPPPSGYASAADVPAPPAPRTRQVTVDATEPVVVYADDADAYRYRPPGSRLGL